MFWQHWSIFILVEAKVLKTQPFTKNVGGAMKNTTISEKMVEAIASVPPPPFLRPWKR